MSYRIGAIDQGTTSTRMLVATEGGMQIAAAFPHVMTYPQPGWVEQDARELLANIRRCLAAAGPLDALGIANQGESCLAWDAVSGEPLSPIIVWQDNRTADALAALPPDAAAHVTALSGLPPDAYFSASKLGWLLHNIPAVAEAHRAGRLHLGTTDAFFLDRLTGTFATDRATASRTALMNLETGEWDSRLCAVFGVPIECLPAIRPNVGDFGTIGSTPVRASIVDQQAALFGHFCRAAGDCKVTFGTGAFALALAGPEAVRPQSGLLPTVAWETGGRTAYALDGGVYDVGSAIDWAVRAGIATGLDDFDFQAGPSAIARGLVFVPAFSGLAAPLWDRSAAPFIIGLSPETTRHDLCRALLEGIAFATANVVGAMAEALPIRSPISIDGGVSQNRYFVQFLADCLDREIVVRGLSERTALGAALLAAEGIGVSLAAPAGGDRRVIPLAPVSRALHARFADAERRSRGWR